MYVLVGQTIMRIATKNSSNQDSSLLIVRIRTQARQWMSNVCIKIAAIRNVL